MSKAFSVILQDLRDGRTHSDLSARFAELVKEVEQTGKAGSLLLTIKVAPASRAQPVDKVIVSPTITLKLPKPDAGEDFFWLSDESELSRNHPRQQALGMELREAPAKPDQLKEAATK